MEKIRALRADEVECRVGRVTKKGCTLLLYKDSRCDKRILDETFGIFGWQDRYEVIKNNLYCTVSIYDPEKNVWVDKCDCGTESYTEKEKGEASDAFKRACFNVGIGRELYTRLNIFIPCETEETASKQFKLKDRFLSWHVNKMTVDNQAEKITEIEIVDKYGNIAFTHSDGKQPQSKLTCSKCGKEIKAVKNSSGKILQPAKVAENTNGLCMACYSAQRISAE